jgi:phosphate-selective porin OprO/OprP
MGQWFGITSCVALGVVLALAGGIRADNETSSSAVPALAPADVTGRDQGSLEATIQDLVEEKKRRQEAEKAKKAADAKKPTVHWTAQLQSDWLMFSQDAASKVIYGDIPNGSAFRRARLGVFGQHELTEYRIEMDFAFAGRPTFLDVYGGLTNPQTHGVFRFGHFFEPFGLERLTPNRYVTFLERSLVDQAFSPVRNLGLLYRRPLFNERATFAIGMFRTDSDVFGEDTGDLFEHAVTGRVTWLPYYRDSVGDRFVLVGASGSFRGANNHQVRFRAQPELRLGVTTPALPFFVDTGIIGATHFFLLGTEAIWVRGPFSIQAEYIAAPVASITAGTLWFQGWYVYASYFLTGEHRPIRRDAAVMDRVVPQRPIVQTRSETGERETGPGAWEIAVRLSHLDLNSGAITGGRITELTVGLNWYLTAYLRMTTNYVHSFANPNGTTRTNTDGFGIRLGYDF